MRRRSLSHLAAISAALLVFAACESDIADGDGADEPPVREVPASEQAAERMADAGVLVAADVPVEWEQAPTPGLAERDPPVWGDFVRGSATCEGLVDSVRDEVVESQQSNTFVGPENSAVGNVVLVYDGELDASRAFARVQSDLTADCFARGVVRVVANRLEDDPSPGVGGGDVAPEVRSPFEVGDEDVRIRARTSDDPAAGGVLDLAAVREGPAVALFVFDWAGPPDDELTQRLVRQSVARMAQQLA